MEEAEKLEALVKRWEPIIRKAGELYRMSQARAAMADYDAEAPREKAAAVSGMGEA